MSISEAHRSWTDAAVDEHVRDLHEGAPALPWCGGRPKRPVLWALLWKNWLLCRRNLAFLFFQFLLPALQIALICLAIGADPTG
jgi:hypothetical protein